MRNRELQESFYMELLNHGKINKKWFGRFIEVFSPEDLDEIGIIMYQSGHYILKKSEGLFEFALKLENEGAYEHAALAYQYCYKIDPTREEYSYKLFHFFTFNNNYRMTFKYLKEILYSKDTSLHVEALLYLYLISFIVTLPSDFSVLFEPISAEQLGTLYDGEKKSIPELLLAQDFMTVLTRFYNKDEHDPFTKESTIRTMLIRIIKHKNDFDYLLKEYSKNNPKDLLPLIQRENRLHPLLEEYGAIESLVKDILSMRETATPTVPVEPNENTFFHLVETKNYSSANELRMDSPVPLDDIFKQLLNLAILTRVHLSLSKKEKTTDIFTLIEIYVREGCGEEADRIITKYLYMKNHERYYFLISRILKLVLLSEDKDCSLLIDTIKSISRKKFKWSPELYLRRAKDAIMAREYAQANIYLEILEIYFKRSRLKNEAPKLIYESLKALYFTKIQEQNPQY